MTRRLRPSRFKLTRVIPDDSLHESLKTYLAKIREFFHLPHHLSLDLEHQMPLLNALSILSQRSGLTISSIAEGNVNLYVPMLAFDPKLNRLILLLPYSAHKYLEIDVVDNRENFISTDKILSSYQEIHQVFLMSSLNHLSYQATTNFAASFFPWANLFLYGLSSVVFALLFLFMTMPTLHETLPLNRIALGIFFSFLLIATCMCLIEARWWSKKNYPLARLMLVKNYLQRLFSQSEQAISLDAAIIAEQIDEIRSSSHNFFLRRLDIIILHGFVAILVVMAFFTNINLGLYLLAILLIALAVIIQVRKKFLVVLETARISKIDLRKSFDQMAASFYAWRGLKSSDHILSRLFLRKALQIDATVAEYRFSFLYHAMHLLNPLICVTVFALFSFNHSDKLSFTTTTIGIILSLFLGLALSLCFRRWLKFHLRPVPMNLVRQIDSWPLEMSNVRVQPVNLVGAIEFINVSFGYQEHSKLIFKNCHLSIKAHEFVFIQGPASCGKTTLLKLLMAALTPQVGQIIFDGQDSRSLDLSALRKHFGVILEDAELFSGSIYDNIMCGRNLTNDALSKLLLSHQIFDHLIDLPMGIETYVFSHQRNISRLERSLILLARALVHEPKFLFADEILNGHSKNEQMMFLDFLSSLNLTCIVTSNQMLPISGRAKIIEIQDQLATEFETRLI